jgi:hypothetical protein
MRINILTENDKVEQVREAWVNKNVLKIPCSATGEEPATHWFCTMAGSEEQMMKIYNKKNLSIMELGIGPKEFLNKWGVKIIK